MEVLEILEGEGWVDIAPPTKEELQEESSVLGFAIDEEGNEYPVRGGIVASQEPSERDKVEGMVCYYEYSTGAYSVHYREVEREIEIDGEDEVKSLPQVRVESDE